MDYSMRKAITLVEAAKQMLADAGFGQDRSIFTRRVADGVVKLAELFDNQRYSVLCGRLVAALFSRIARGSPPTAEFLKEVWAEIEKAAEDFPYDEEDEKRRWIQNRYPVLQWAGDLRDHVSGMVFPKPETQKFAGAPLVRDDPDPQPPGVIDDEPLPQPKAVRMSELIALVGEGKIISAIKLYRQATGKGLKESRDFVYELRDSMKPSGLVDDNHQTLFGCIVGSPQPLDHYGSRLGAVPSFAQLDHYGSGLAFSPADLTKNETCVSGKAEGTIPVRDVTLYPDNLAKAIEKAEDNMCSNSKIVGIIGEFCRNLESFTSLDVSNKAKADGLVARHREIAEQVRAVFNDGEMSPYGYVRDLIDVTIPGGLTAATFLYHHTTVPADDYKNRAQVAIRPQVQPTPQVDDDDDSLPAAPTSVAPAPLPPSFAIAPPAPPAAPRLTRMLNTSSVTRTQKGDGRLEVPHVWLTRLGWQVGDTVQAVRDGNSLILKTSVQPGERTVRQFTVDRWNRIRITTKALNDASLHLGTGGQHIMTLRTGDIKID